MELGIDSFFNTINDYINKEFNNVANYNNAIKYFLMLDEFLMKYDFSLNIDLVIRLINENKIFYNMVKLIIMEYNLYEKNNKTFNSNSLVLALEAYFMLGYDEFDSNRKYDSNERIYIDEIRKIPLLSSVEEKELAIKISQGDILARRKFIESNLRLVVNFARMYLNRGLPLLDLIQEGNLGLITAVDKYDVNKEVRFSTYASYWINGKIKRAIANKVRNIRIPVNVYDDVITYKNMRDQLKQELNREPSFEDMANQMKLSIDKVKRLHILQVDTISANECINDEEDDEMVKYLFTSYESAEDIVIGRSLRFYMKQLLERCNLTPMELKVLTYRYGLDGTGPLYLEQVGKLVGLTKQRISKIEMRALMKIRLFNYTNSLAIYTQNPSQSLKYLTDYQNEIRANKVKKLTK